MRMSFRLKLYSLIFYVLLWGPPAGLDRDRGVEASLQGKIDLIQISIIAFWIILGLIILTKILVLVKYNSQIFKHIIKYTPNKLYILYSIICISSFFYSINPYFTLYNSIKVFFGFIFVFLFGLEVLRENKGLNYILKIIYNYSILYVLYTFLMSIFDPQKVAFISDTGFYRIIGGWPFEPTYGREAAYILFYNLLVVKGKNMPKINLIILFISIYLIALSQTRTLYLSILIFTFIQIFYLKTKSSRLKLFVLVIIVILMLFFNSEWFYAYIVRNTQSLTTLSGRLNVWQFAYEKFLENPIFGYGYIAGNRYIAVLSNTGFGDVHNNYLGVMLGVGILGFVPICLLLLSINLKLLKLARKNEKHSTFFLYFSVISLIWGYQHFEIMFVLTLFYSFLHNRIKTKNSVLRL